MEMSRELASMDAEALRNLSVTLLARLADKDAQLLDKGAQLVEKDAQLAKRDQEIKNKQLKIDQLTHEMAVLKRYRFDRRSEQMDPQQRLLLDESIDADIAAIGLEIDSLIEKPASPPKEKPRRVALPAAFPRREVRHELDVTQCRCGCQLERIGEDVSEKLDYTPGVFEVEHHIRGKWVCRRCEELVQALVPPQVIDKGIPTAGLALPRSTLAQWVGACGMRLAPLVEAMKAQLLTRPVLHADETPVPMLKPGLGRTHRAYLWSYATSEYDELKTVIYDFADGRAGVHAREFLGAWTGKLVCDDYSGYKALFELYEIEGEARELNLDAVGLQQLRQQRSKPIAESLRQWLTRQRNQVPDGSATHKAIDYSLGRWAALTRYIDDGDLPIDNNHIENRIRPIALGRNNWLFAGSLRAGQRAANVMSLIQSVKLNGHEPYRNLKDVLERLRTQPASRLQDLLPHRWQPDAATE